MLGFTQTVRDNDGYVWESWTSMEKSAFVTGYMTGHDTIRSLLEDMPEPPSEDIKEFATSLYNWSYYKGTVDDVVKLLNRFYENPEYRKFPIYEVILVMYEKDWWTEKENKK
jgi:hypothetical protein